MNSELWLFVFRFKFLVNINLLVSYIEYLYYTLNAARYTLKEGVITMSLAEIIKVARGEKEADLLLKNGKIINVFSGEIYTTDVVIYKDMIVGLGEGYNAVKEIDVSGCYLSPGFMDGHIHLESSMVKISEFAKTVVPMGTTSVIIDPHEIANVLGLEGIRYMLESSKYNPLNIFMMLPSCVPASSLGTSGADLSVNDLFPLLDEKWVL